MIRSKAVHNHYRLWRVVQEIYREIGKASGRPCHTGRRKEKARSAHVPLEGNAPGPEAQTKKLNLKTPINAVSAAPMLLHTAKFAAGKFQLPKLVGVSNGLQDRLYVMRRRTEKNFCISFAASISDSQSWSNPTI